MEYGVVHAQTIPELEERVNASMLDEWTPQGGVSYGKIPDTGTFNDTSKLVFMQAMIRI